jgi:hypothetical protein
MQSSPPRVHGLAGLVDELDDRLPRTTPAPPPRRDVRRRVLPRWIALALTVFVVLGAAWAAFQPTGERCEFDESICAIEDLDIDALLVTVPDADLFDLLPPIEQIDPDDSLTLGDVLRLEGIRDVDPSTLLTPSQVDRVLRQLD